MEEEQERISRLQQSVANDVIIQNYDYIVGCVNAILIFPYLVSSRVVVQDFRQYLDGERTDKDKMMALLRELNRSPQETCFKEFIGALSKIRQYKPIVDHLLKDFTELMVERQAHPPSEGGKEGRPRAMMDTAASKPVAINVTSCVTGVDEVMKKALEDAKAGHEAALIELLKASALVLEAEKGKAHTEAEKLILEERVQEDSRKLREADERLRVTEMDKQLLEKEAESYKEEVRMNMQRTELEKMQLTENIAKVRLQEKAARKKVQELEEERAALGKQVAGLQADVVRVMREREEEVSSLKQQLSDASIQQQTLKEELKALWQETGKHSRMDVAPEELGELQSSRKDELSRVQLVSSVNSMATLQVELDETKSAKEELEEIVRGLRKELAENKQEGRGSKNERKKKEGRGRGLKTEPRKNASKEAEVKARLEQEEMGLERELDTI